MTNFSDAFIKVGLILVLVFFSILAQLNLKATSGILPLSWNELMSMDKASSFLILIRTLFLSGASLLISWYAYKKFGYLEFLVAQSALYFFAIFVSFYFLNEPLTWNKLVSVVFICMGIGLFYLK